MLAAKTGALSLIVSVVTWSITAAHQTPLMNSESEQSPDKSPQGKRIAIIGAGVAGTRAAYEIHELSLGLDHPPALTIFDSNPDFGGRIIQAKIHDAAGTGTDAGAADLAPHDSCMLEALASVGLQTHSSRIGPTGHSLGIWDGEDFLVRANKDLGVFPASWSEYSARLRRYGWPFERLRHKTMSAQDAFQTLGIFNSFRNLTQALVDKGLFSEATQSAHEYLSLDFNLSSPLFQELVIPTIRHQLTADLRQVSALDALLAIATPPSDLLRPRQSSLKRLLNRQARISEAGWRPLSHVNALGQLTDGRWEVEITTVNDTESTSRSIYDIVVLAAPLQMSYLDIFTPKVSPHPAPLDSEGVARYVTLFSSLNRLDPTAFNRPANEALPDDILFADGDLGDLGIFSITTATKVNPVGAGDDDLDVLEYVYRISSEKPVPDSYIARLFSLDQLTVGQLETVTWLQREEWPYAFPIHQGGRFPESLELAPALYYTAGGEDAVRGMEMSCRMGKTVGQEIWYNHLAGPLYP